MTLSDSKTTVATNANPARRRTKAALTVTTALGAAYALDLILTFGDRDDRSESRKMRSIADEVRRYFRGAGVSFNPSGSPLLPSVHLDPAWARAVHADASEAAWRAIEAAVRALDVAGDASVRDLVTTAFFSAFNEGADLDINIAGHDVRREVHACERGTGKCLGHQDL